MRITKTALVVTLLGSQVLLAVADSLPKLNVGPTCDAAARGAINLGRDKDACMGDEREAQNEITKKWPQYSTSNKAQCIGMVTKGRSQSYVELISCLDIMRDAAAISKADPLFGRVGPNSKDLNLRAALPQRK